MYTLSLHCHSVIEQLWRGNGISSVGWCLFIVWGDGVYVQIGSPGLCENAYTLIFTNGIDIDHVVTSVVIWIHALFSFSRTHFATADWDFNIRSLNLTYEFGISAQRLKDVESIRTQHMDKIPVSFVYE